MFSRYRFSAIGVCLAFLCAVGAGPAMADRGHVRVPVPAHGDLGLAPADGHGHFGTEIEGLVTAVDTGAGTISITDDDLGPVVVTVDDSTVIRHGWTVLTLDQIPVGARVHVKASPQDGGGYLAAAVFVQNNGTGGSPGPGTECDTEVQGSAGAIDCGAGTLVVMTDASGEVTIALTDATQYFGPHHAPAACADLADGDAVEIEGALQSDASIVACKVSFQPPKSCDDEISGTVKATPDCAGGTMVVTTGSGDVDVTLTDTTAYFGKKHASATCGDVAAGDAAEIEGTLQGDGSIVACKVSFEAPEVEEVDVSGTISGAPDGTTMTFVLTTDQGDVTIDVNSSTVIQEHHNAMTFADLADGTAVEVEGVLQGDGSILATKISIESED